MDTTSTSVPTTRTATGTPSASVRASNGRTGAVPTVAPRSGGALAAPPVLRRAADPGPRLRQLMGVCGWAAVLGGIGLVLGIRGMIGVLAGDPPGWYEPSTIVAGMVGICLTIGSFLTVHRTRAPWVLLTCASATLAVAMVFTSVAF